MQLFSSRHARGLVVLCVAAGSLMVGAHAAGADPKTVNVSCPDSRVINPDGSTGDIILPGADPVVFNTTVPGVTGTNELPGSSFTAQAPSVSVDVPSTIFAGAPISSDIPIDEVKNIKLTIKVTGAASIGTPSLSGGTVTNASASKTGADTIEVTFPGNTTGSTIPGGDLYFVSGTTFQTPALSLPVTAANADGQITFTLAHFDTDSAVVLGSELPARASCSVQSGNPLGTITVHDPRSPHAKADSATTPKDTAVTIDVMKNDTGNDLGDPIDPTSLAIGSKPAHGTAEVEDGKILYTPSSGYQGDDSFTYVVCANVEQVDSRVNKSTQQFCATGNVSVTVGSVGQEGGGSGSSTTTTTVAKEMPRTGSSSAPLALAGFGLAGIGAGLAFTNRKRRSA